VQSIVNSPVPEVIVAELTRLPIVKLVFDPQIAQVDIVYKLFKKFKTLYKVSATKLKLIAVIMLIAVDDTAQVKLSFVVTVDMQFKTTHWISCAFAILCVANAVNKVPDVTL
jgi:hypothetical protein